MNAGREANHESALAELEAKEREVLAELGALSDHLGAGLALDQRRRRIVYLRLLGAVVVAVLVALAGAWLSALFWPGTGGIIASAVIGGCAGLGCIPFLVAAGEEMLR